MTSPLSKSVTQVLRDAETGDLSATEKLFPLVYDELRRMAQLHMNRENPDHTLQATALVHEAYLKLVASTERISWKSRGHFFSAAAEAMRRLLVDHARRRLAEKRGGQLKRESLSNVVLAKPIPPEQMLAFNETLEQFCQVDPVKGQLVKLRCFAGLDREAISNSLDISLATVDRYWKYAKVRLYCELTDGYLPEDSSSPTEK